MAKKKGKGKKKKKEAVQKTSEEIFLEELTIIVEERLRKEKWSVEDSAMKKKLSKKDKQKLARRRQEELKAAVVVERKRLEEEEKRRLEEERLAAIEKEKRDLIEQELRIGLLVESLKRIKKLKKKFLKAEKEELDEKQWEQYLKCDGLPDPSNCGEMNTFLHLWDQTKENTTIPDAITKTKQVLALLETLDEFIDCPAVSTQQRNDWIAVRSLFKEYQQYNLDCAAYRLLRDVDNKLDRYDIPTSGYVCVQDAFTICLWALVQLPIPTPNPKTPKRPRTHLEFPELDCEVLFPAEIDVWALCVRVMYVNYDHYSHLCENLVCPRIPEELLLDLNKTTQIEWEEKIQAKKNIRDLVRTDIEENIKQAFLAYQDNTDSPDAIQAYKAALRKREEYVKVDASDIYCNIEDSLYIEYRSQMETITEPTTINLRKYRILGGVFYLNLFYQPPQPTRMVLNEITIATLQVPKWLMEVPFQYDYTPPAPPEPGVVRLPEEIEEELIAQEAELDKMLFISLSLTKNVLWLDVPIVCQWNSEEKIWSTKNIHEAKHNEEKQTIQFRTGCFGPFATAISRYNSMPFQAWEIKPTAQGTIVFTLMASVLIIEFIIQNGLVCISQLQNAPSEALDSIVGVYYKLPKLIRILQNGGIDFFPEPDAFNYINGACEKQWPVEKHLYYNMAQVCLCYNFSWSRWNLTAGRRKIVFQMREFSTSERAKIGDFGMLMVTPIKALFIDCTEISQTFIEEPVAKTKFAPDLYHLVLNTASASMKKKISTSPQSVINVLAQLLLATRITSLS